MNADIVMTRVYDLIVHRPKSIVLSILLLTGFFAYHAQHIRLDSSVESLLPRGDTEKAYYDEVRGLFGSDEVGVIGIITDNVYAPHVLDEDQAADGRDPPNPRGEECHQSHERTGYRDERG